MKGSRYFRPRNFTNWPSNSANIGSSGIDLEHVEYVDVINCRAYCNGGNGLAIRQGPALGAGANDIRVNGGFYYNNAASGIRVGTGVLRYYLEQVRAYNDPAFPQSLQTHGIHVFAENVNGVIRDVYLYGNTAEQLYYQSGTKPDGDILDSAGIVITLDTTDESPSVRRYPEARAFKMGTSSVTRAAPQAK